MKKLTLPAPLALLLLSLPLVACGSVSLMRTASPASVSTATPPQATATPIGRSTLTPAGPSTTTPAPFVASPAPVDTPTVRPTSYVVGNTDGLGVYVRRSPRSQDRIIAWPDGTRMLVVGAYQQAGGATWKSVQDPAGNVGWIASQYLNPSPPPAPGATPTPLRNPTTAPIAPSP